MDQMVFMEKNKRVVELGQNALFHLLFRDRNILQCSLLINRHDLIMHALLQFSISQDRHQRRAAEASHQIRQFAQC